MNDDFSEIYLGKYSECSFNSFYEKYNRVKEKGRGHSFSSERDYSSYLRMVDLFNNLDANDDLLFRKNSSSDEGKIFNWISSVKNKANLIQSFNSLDYKGVDKKQLINLVKLSRDQDFLVKIPKMLLSYGVIVVYQDYIPGMKLDGVLFKNDFGVPVIGISFRYKRVDSFWFTLIHELCHLVLHYEIINNFIIEDFDVEDESRIESEANKLARDILIPKQAWRSSDARVNKSKNSVLNLAERLGIHPAIIAGRIRFENDNYSLLNGIEGKIEMDILKNGKN